MQNQEVRKPAHGREPALSPRLYKIIWSSLKEKLIWHTDCLQMDESKRVSEMYVADFPEARVTPIPHAGFLVAEKAYSAVGSGLEGISETDIGQNGSKGSKFFP